PVGNTIDVQTHAATEKTPIVAADEIGYWDSISGLLRKITWANLLSTAITAITTAANTWSLKQIFTGWMKVQQSLEKLTITAAAPSATQHLDVITQAIQYFTTNATANWTLNIRGNSGTTLDSQMAVGESLTVSVW
ncbi:hypothetical protein JZU71_03725, partial [bacterium]|nr:hypothetical protein [bacterium]